MKEQQRVGSANVAALAEGGRADQAVRAGNAYGAEITEAMPAGLGNIPYNRY